MLGIIDDPFANWMEAQSPTVCANRWEWYQSVFRTRIWEGGAIVIIMTRWSQNDTAGKLLQAQADKWHVLRLPALAETQTVRDTNDVYLGLPPGRPDPLGRLPGEALAPRRFSRETLLDIKQDVGSLVWAAEYDGVPRAAEGNRIKRDWLKLVEASTVKAERIRYWDKAGTEDGGAYTSGVLIARTEEGIYFVEDVVRGQWSAYQRETVIRQTAELDRQRHGAGVKIWIEQEPGSGGKESAEATIRNLAGFAVYAERPTGDKDVRLEPFAAQAEAGNVSLLRGVWNYDYIEELVTIPNSAYRDQADATAGAFNKLAQRRELGVSRALDTLTDYRG
jgi:predicted phage terminase large subunit-like protein